MAVEGAAAGIPHVYIGSLLFYFKLFETPDRFFFFGARTRTGYRYQDSDFSDEKWHNFVGDNFLVLKRNGIFMALDLTIRGLNDRSLDEPNPPTDAERARSARTNP